MHGFMPVKADYSDLYSDFNLFGKLVFYEKGFIFVDQRLNSFVLSYPEIVEINFYIVIEFFFIFNRLKVTGWK